MDFGKGIFTIKLYELEQQYEQLQSRILLYQQADHQKIRLELQRVEDVCKEDEIKLQKSIAFCCSPAVADLSGVQKEYVEKARSVLEHHIEKYGNGTNPENQEKRAEAMTLYAEYAIDFATQAMNHAQLAALSAIDLQMTVEEAAAGK